MNRYQDTLKTALLSGIRDQEREVIYLDPVVRHIEREMQWILQSLPFELLRTEGILPDEPTVSSIYELLSKAIRRILHDSSASSLTVNDVAESLVEHKPPQPAEPNSPDWAGVLQQAAVAAVGWITLLFS